MCCVEPGFVDHNCLTNSTGNIRPEDLEEDDVIAAQPKTDYQSVRDSVPLVVDNDQSDIGVISVELPEEATKNPIPEESSDKTPIG